METQYTSEQEQAYNALRIAADRIGKNNFANGLYHGYKHNGRYMGGYHITQAHKDVVEAMPKVLSGAISPAEAMALLHSYDVFHERIESKA